MIYWLESFKQIYKLVSNCINKDNFLIIPLNDLQKDSKTTLQMICTFLSIEFESVIYNLSLCGEPTGGNANEKSLNSGTIANRTSRIKFPMYTFEKRLISSIQFYNYDKQQFAPIISFNILQCIKSSFYTSFIEIKTDKLSIKSQNSIFYNIKDRILIFVKFYFAVFDRINNLRNIYLPIFFTFIN